MLEEVEVFEGDFIWFECCVGFGVDVFWYIGDEFLKEDDWVMIENEGDVFVVVIFFIELDDEVEYKCVVWNDFGEVIC